MHIKYSVLPLIAAAVVLFNIILIKQVYGAQSCAVPSASQLAGISNGDKIYLALSCLSGNELYDVLYNLSPSIPPSSVSGTPSPITQNTLYNTLSLMNGNQIYAVLSKLRSKPNYLYSVFEYLLQPSQTYGILSELSGNESYKLLNKLNSTELYYVLSSLSDNNLYSVLNSLKSAQLYNLLNSLSPVELYLLLSNHLSNIQKKELNKKLKWWQSLWLFINSGIGYVELHAGVGKPSPPPNLTTPPGPPGTSGPSGPPGTSGPLGKLCTPPPTTNGGSTSTSCSAQFTITAASPNGGNSAQQKSITSGFSTIVN